MSGQDTAPDLHDLQVTLHHDPHGPATHACAVFLSRDGGWAKCSLTMSQGLVARALLATLQGSAS